MLPADPKNHHSHRATREDGPPSSAGYAPELDYASASAATLGPPPALSAAPNLATLLNALRRSWKMAVPVALGGATLAAVVTWFLVPPQYTSNMLFRILSRAPQGWLEADSDFSSVQKSQVALMKSHEVLSETIEKSRVAELHGVSINPAQLQKKLTTSFLEGPEMLNVSLPHSDPEVATALLNALGEVFPSKTNKTEELRVKQLIVQLERRLSVDQHTEPGHIPNLAEELRDKRIELQNAEKQYKLDQPDELKDKLNAARGELSDAKRNLGTVSRTKVNLQTELTVKRSQLDRLPTPVISDAEAEDGLRNDAEFKDLSESIAKVQKEIDDWKARTDRSFWNKYLAEPRKKLKNFQAQRGEMLDEMRSKLTVKVRKETQNKLRGEILDIEAKLQGLAREEESLREEVSKLEKKAELLEGGGPKPPPPVLRLRDEVAQKEKEYNRVGEQLAAMKSSLPLQPRVVRYSDASTPNEKDISRPMKFSLAAAGIVFFCLLSAFCLLEARGRRVYAASDVSESLGLATIGILPRIPAAARTRTAAQTLLSGDSPCGLNEAVDAIRTVLLHSPRLDGARVVMVASASEGEGKTTLASHLAASLARSWRKTLLIDGDLRNPNQHKQFEQPLEPGLAEALRGEVEFEDVIRPTQVSRLWLLPAGAIDAHALQALAQEGVGAIFEWFKEQYDFIVIDSSPVLPVPDALMLGKHADAVLMAVMKDVSRMPAVYQAQQRFESLQIRVLGSVVIGEKTERYGYAVNYGPKQV